MADSGRERKRARGASETTVPTPSEHCLLLQLRCPWCCDGLLVRPVRKRSNEDDDSDDNPGKGERVHLCTSGTLCPYDEVLQNDSTMAFSGINAHDLLLRFYAALDTHLLTCTSAAETSPRGGRLPLTWSIVAERSPLFQAFSDWKGLMQEGSGGGGDTHAPVFYFFVCESCDERSKTHSLVSAVHRIDMAMLLLEKVHPSVQAAVDRILSLANKTPTTVVRDFDGCEYHIRVDWEEEAAVAAAAKGNENQSGRVERAEDRRASVTIALRHTTRFKELNAHGNFDAVLSSLFPVSLQKFLKGGSASSRGDEGFVAEVHIPASASTATRCDALRAAAQLRIWSFIPVFARQCELYLTQPDLVKPFVLQYHAGEDMVLFNHKGSFIVAIAMRIATRDEAILTRHFLQAMVDAKKLQRVLSAAPAFAFDHNKVPDALPNDLRLSCTSGSNFFWCSFQLFRRQMEPVEHLVETVTQLVNFRSTLAYHIHAGRTYMHGMMRKRVETSLQVLNRAKTRTTGKAKVALH